MHDNLTTPAGQNSVGCAQHVGHQGAVFWLTGLSGSGKSTLAIALQAALTQQGFSCYVLDGDQLRRGLNANLGFSAQDRTENIRRVGEVAALFADAGLICISACISPYQVDRARARSACAHAFHEIHIAASLDTCEVRDTKGLYKKARSGELLEFTGVSAPYEVPTAPQLRIDTDRESIEESSRRLLAYAIEQLAV